MSELTEEQIIEEREKREKVMSKADLEIFNKFKKIVFLGDNEVVTINQVAEYYGVDKNTIKQLVHYHRDEFEEDGVRVFRKDNLRQLKNNIKNSTQLGNLTEYNLYDKIKRVPSITVFPRRAVLRVGMLLRDSEIAKQIRDYLLNVEEVADTKTKEWAVLRKAGIMVRKDFTADIARSGEPNRLDNYAYGYYTNMAYRMLFDKKADQLKREMGVDSIRDNLSEEDLEELRRIERSIGGLLLADFKGEEILEMLG